MGADEIDKHLVEIQRELMKIRGVLASGGIPEDVGKTRELRRAVARILTIKKELSTKKKPGKDTKEVTKKK